MKKILLILCLSLIFIGSLICEEKNVFVSKIENLSDKLVIEGFNDSYLYETKDGNLFLSMILYVEKIYGVKPSFFKFGWDDSTVSGQFYLLLDKEKKIMASFNLPPYQNDEMKKLSPSPIPTKK